MSQCDSFCWNSLRCSRGRAERQDLYLSHSIPSGRHTIGGGLCQLGASIFLSREKTDRVGNSVHSLHMVNVTVDNPPQGYKKGFQRPTCSWGPVFSSAQFSAKWREKPFARKCPLLFDHQYTHIKSLGVHCSKVIQRRKCVYYPLTGKWAFLAAFPSLNIHRLHAWSSNFFFTWKFCFLCLFCAEKGHKSCLFSKVTAFHMKDDFQQRVTNFPPRNNDIVHSRALPICIYNTYSIKAKTSCKRTQWLYFSGCFIF